MWHCFMCAGCVQIKRYFYPVAHDITIDPIQVIGTGKEIQSVIPNRLVAVANIFNSD